MTTDHHTIVYYIWIIKYILYVIAFISHIIGIHALTRYANVSRNALILLKLSVVELAGMTFSISTDLSHVSNGCHSQQNYGMKKYGSDKEGDNNNKNNNNSDDKFLKRFPHDHELVNTLTYRTIASDFVLTMIIINLDIFFSVLTPSMYKRYMMIRTMKGISVASVFLALLNGLLFTLIPRLKTAFQYEGIAALLVFVLIFLVSYISIAAEWVRKMVKGKLLSLYYYLHNIVFWIAFRHCKLTLYITQF